MALSVLFRALRDEYLGWKRFHALTGFWPKWSILCTAVIPPAALICATAILVWALSNYRTGFLRWALSTIAAFPALVWFALRKIAAAADAAAAAQAAPLATSCEELERILR
jgi:hypothetical protein